MSRIDRFISVVAPLRNDGGILGPFVADVVPVLRDHFTNYELLLVDDGSTDDTLAIAARSLEEHECVRLIRLTRSFGEEIAITAGLDSAIGDFAVVLLPNYDPPALIPTLVDRARESGAGIVYGIPRSQPDETLFTRAGAAIWYWFARRVLRADVEEDAAHYRVLTRQAVTAMVRVRRRYRHLRVLSADIGFTTVGVEYDPIVRNPRRPRRSFFERARVAIAVLIANSPSPLRFATTLGALAALVNLGWSVSHTMRAGAPGAADGPMPVPLAAMFFLLFIVLAVLGEYVVHVFIESHDRPLYHVLGERSSAVDLADRDRRNIAVSSVAEKE